MQERSIRLRENYKVFILHILPKSVHNENTIPPPLADWSFMSGITLTSKDRNLCFISFYFQETYH